MLKTTDCVNDAGFYLERIIKHKDYKDFLFESLQEVANEIKKMYTISFSRAQINAAIKNSKKPMLILHKLSYSKSIWGTPDNLNKWMKYNNIKGSI